MCDPGVNQNAPVESEAGKEVGEVEAHRLDGDLHLARARIRNLLRSHAQVGQVPRAGHPKGALDGHCGGGILYLRPLGGQSSLVLTSFHDVVILPTSSHDRSNLEEFEIASVELLQIMTLDLRVRDSKKTV